MKSRNTIVVCAAMMIGFILGTLCTRQATVKAQSGMQVYVEHHKASAMEKEPTSIPAKQVVGFSCAADMKGSMDCYTAYIK